MADYYFKDEAFIIEDFDKKKTFASFLPGLAGKKGIPLWAFYVNRGQGITSFGLENKDRAILEFSPAVKAYKTVGTDGFRTFIKIDGKVTELFGENNAKTKRKMIIKRSEFSIIEKNLDLNLTTKVTYFGLPNDNLAGLVRIVEVTNDAKKPVEFELLDGVSQLLPTGVSMGDMKNIANLIRSWMEVYSLEDDFGYFRMRSSSSDTAEIKENKSGNFYVSSCEEQLIKPIVDNRLVFGHDTTKTYARFFEDNTIEELRENKQITANKIPVGFSPIKKKLSTKESVRINTVIGYAHSTDYITSRLSDLVSTNYIDQKRLEASTVLNDILQEVDMDSNSPIFDDYIKQNYLDNVLRGGYPLVLGNSESPNVYHLFSRRHGDLERDYNYFTIAPEFYSQGNGSFRDVCQNRRNDVLLNPEVKRFNFKMFASLIQADGFNPLSIDGSSFTLRNKEAASALTKKLFHNSDLMRELLEGRFTPGSIINTMANENIKSDFSDEELLEEIFAEADQHIEAHFAEGYWIDHWTYILDLVENYEAVFPDKMTETLYNDRSYKYFDSPIYVLPRDEKTCLVKKDKIRRYGSTLHNDDEKIKRNNMEPNKAAWLKTEKGKVVEGSLFEKLLVLSVNKIASLDPSGMGIEMEAEKPGWNDAMNGLPGLFGSGVSETLELKRVVKYLIDHYNFNETIKLPIEFKKFAIEIHNVLKANISDYNYWDNSNIAKEAYRKAIRFNTRKLEETDNSMVYELLKTMDRKLDSSISKAVRFGDGIIPTYLVHTVTDYEQIKENNQDKIGHYGYPVVRAKQFKVRALPRYLEAPARALKVVNNDKLKQDMFQRIKESNIYDHELKFYKTSEFLDDESNEIGRGRSFTKGWQERESNFLHMTYKYLLGLLKGGLYDDYFEEIKTNLTCFMNPEVYGRSTLENSSFIVSSINPDPEIRGQGYVARLSGSTAEMLSIWAMMMFGKYPFVLEDGLLTLNLKPIISKEFFKNEKLSFTFLGSIKVTYHNQSNIDTFDPDFKIRTIEIDGKEYKDVQGTIAKKVRDRDVETIDVYF